MRIPLAVFTAAALSASAAHAGREHDSSSQLRAYLKLILKKTRNRDVPSTWNVKPKPPTASDLSGGSPNQKLLQQAWHYAWARYTNDANADKIRQDFVTQIFTGPSGQFTKGHYAIDNRSEVLTSSHYQLWAEGVAGARLVALSYGDRDVLAATGQWMREEKALWDTLQHGGVIDAPGGRFDKPGEAHGNDLRDVNYSQYKNKASPNRPEKFYDNTYNASAWMLRELLAENDTLGGPASAPKDWPRLGNPLCVCGSPSGGGDFVIAFSQTDLVTDPIRWVARLGGKIQYGPYHWQPQTPPPRLPGAQLTALPGLVGSCVDADNVPLCASAATARANAKPGQRGKAAPQTKAPAAKAAQKRPATPSSSRYR